ncbi:cell division cycle protein 16 homolog [Tribolium madens]|uniref:cell division cycle protein 16 homolog n=1 Tax=Tribolium madens TaxID=41895 RepID=UPI001CF72EC8|nr:cell division cycle protein 16 homolog [Tribolium madens]
MNMTNTTANVDIYRKLVKTYLDLHGYQSALFWADKVVTLTGNPRDVYWLAQCMFMLKQYHRASHLLRSKNLDKSYILCNCLTARCLLEANEFNEALQVLNSIDFDFSTENAANIEALLFDETPKNQVFSSVFLLKGRVFESMDNRGLAADCYKQALQYDVYCFEAFESLIKYQMLTAREEEELINALPIMQQCNGEEAEILLTLYGSKLKKYHTPIGVKITERNSSELILNSIPSLPTTPSVIASTSISSTPNVARNNDKNLMKNVEHFERPVLTKLKQSLDMQVAEAERLYYNCDYQQCSELTEAILREDPYHNGCLPIHIACQVELKLSNKLFSLAHKLVDLYPNLAISWFAVGCYYYIIGKSDCARRFLSKATCLDRLFGPAWLAYGHSFAIENEHDQAMAAYFKASQLMKGCHLPLLYIGLECGLTNNVRLAEKFFKQAQNIAPDDPFVMHEMGVIAFQNLNFKDAEKHFKDALARIRKVKSNPDIIPKRWQGLLNNLGHTCRKLKKYEEALDFHHQALLLAPQSASTYSAIAFVHALMGHTEDAVDWFHKALGLRIDDSFCTTMLNYVIEQLAEEKPPYPGAPEFIPKFDIETKALGDTETETSQANEESASMAPSEMSMSIEVDMADASGINKE